MKKEKIIRNILIICCLIVLTIPLFIAIGMFGFYGLLYLALEIPMSIVITLMFLEL